MATFILSETVAGDGLEHGAAEHGKEGSRLGMRRSTVRIRSPAPAFRILNRPRIVINQGFALDLDGPDRAI